MPTKKSIQRTPTKFKGSNYSRHMLLYDIICRHCRRVFVVRGNGERGGASWFFHRSLTHNEKRHQDDGPAAHIAHSQTPLSRRLSPRSPPHDTPSLCSALAPLLLSPGADLPQQAARDWRSRHDVMSVNSETPSNPQQPSTMEQSAIRKKPCSRQRDEKMLIIIWIWPNSFYWRCLCGGWYFVGGWTGGSSNGRDGRIDSNRTNRNEVRCIKIAVDEASSTIAAMDKAPSADKAEESLEKTEAI